MMRGGGGGGEREGVKGQILYFVNTFGAVLD